MRIKVKIICPIHGEFEQTPDNHLKKCGCPSCGNVKVPTTEDFIINANTKHNNKYDYSLVDYIGSHIKIKIICPIHGEFEQTPTNHTQGQGCPKCNGKQLTQSEILDKFKKIHRNRYDYSLVKYINNKKEITIICPVHGIFYQTPQNHLAGYGCQICGGSNKKTLDEFILQASKIHNNKYDYSSVNYVNARTKIEITCPNHGIFTQKPTHHLSGVGCPYCKESRGEKVINEFLIENNINFERQYKFKDCKYKYCLPFDFYLPKYNLCIEFDGIQHFESIKYWGGDVALSKQIIKDKIKNEYCKNNNIDLIRIRYNENIIDKLKLALK
jgi:very-short-patch-repair endonuclease